MGIGDLSILLIIPSENTNSSPCGLESAYIVSPLL